MDDVIDELVRIARKCDRNARPFVSGNFKNMYAQLISACNEVGLSWSGSFIGYHAETYLHNFATPRPGEIFDSEWGSAGGFISRSRGDWCIVTYEMVEDEIKRRAKISDFDPLNEAVDAVIRVFDESKAELLPLFDALTSEHEADRVLEEGRKKLKKLDGYFSQQNFANSKFPRGQVMSRDSLAIHQGLRLPHHLIFETWLLSRYSNSAQVEEIAKIARHASRYLEQKYKMKGKTLGKKDGRIFIGHGRSNDWSVLKDFIRDRLQLDYDEFNRDSPAGLTGKERLEQMLDNACFAFLVMTAEDEHADGTRHARENVIHEIGLFQGRLGFSRAIILLEEGCEEFSNVHGIQQIRFKKNDLQAKRDDIRQVLEREGIL